MRIKTSLIIGLICITPILRAVSQDIEFDHITVENGLSQNTVHTAARDSRGFMWFGTNMGLNRYDSRYFKVYKNDPRDSSSLSWNTVSHLFSDSKGNLWVGTYKGLNLYDPDTDSFTRLPLQEKKKGTLQEENICQVFEDSRKNIWVGTTDGLYLLLSLKERRFRRFTTADGLLNNSILSIMEDRKGNLWLGSYAGLTCASLARSGYTYKNFYSTAGTGFNYIRSIEEDGRGDLWLGTSQGVIFFDTGKQQIVFKAPGFDIPVIKDKIQKIYRAKDGRIWVGGQNGIYVYSPGAGTLQLYDNDPDNPASLNQNSVSNIFQDADRSIWVTTYYGGVNITYEKKNHFTVLKKGDPPYGLASNVVSGVVEDEKNNLVVSSFDAGLSILDRKTNTFSYYRSKDGKLANVTSDIINLVYRDAKKKIWTGSLYLGWYNAVTRKIRTFSQDTFNIKHIDAICEWKENEYLVASHSKKIFVFNDRLGKYTRPDSIIYTFFLDKQVTAIFKDKSGNIWFGTEHGLYVRRWNGGHIQTIMAEPLASGYINDIQEGGQKNIWIGTEQSGLCQYDLSTGTCTTYTKAEGLPGNNVLGIQEDNYGFLWLSTFNGLCRFDAREQVCNNYNVQDGLPGNIFTKNACYKDNKGLLYFGSYQGVVIVDPSRIWVNRRPSPLVFTGFNVSGQSKNDTTPYGFLQNKSGTEANVTLDYNQNVFTINFAILNYIKPFKNYYVYQLAGLDNKWNHVTDPSITFADLPSGKYTLLIKGFNNDGIGSRAPLRLQITILPPPWLSWWAYTFYILLTAGVLFLTIRYIAVRNRLKVKEQVHQMKLDFFTNISHELKTPLTLIQSSIESVLREELPDKSVRDKILLAKINAGRLVRLVSEFLQFRKAETAHLKLSVAEHGLISFSKEIFISFYELAERKHISYSFKSDVEELPLYFDDMQLEKVLYNLLSNAFKFTRPGGTILLEIISAGEKEVSIRVTNTGDGIPAEEQQDIFTNYYQSGNAGMNDAGTGIGLALAKSIVSLHKGLLAVQTLPDKEAVQQLTRFTVTLKKGKAHFQEEELIKEPVPAGQYAAWQPPEDIQTVQRGNPCTLLIIEDNAPLRGFIADGLALKYHVIQAGNGQEGVRLALKEIPDLIVSDMMMPDMNGIEVIKAIKQDLSTSHVPVILLTAFSDKMHQMEGLQAGADLFVSKPFSTEILEMNIHNLLSAREAIRRNISQQLFMQSPQFATNPKEEAFLMSLIKTVEQNLSNHTFNIDDLAVGMAMSRTVLYRKVKAVTGITVNELIKSVRLKKAAELLVSRQYAIYEVASQVGFSDLKHFRKEFKKQFGKNPSEFASG